MRALIAAGVLLVCAFASEAASQEAAGVDRPEVWSVAGREVLRIRASVGDMTPKRRVELLDQRLTDILSEAETAIGVGDIEMHVHGKTVTITVLGVLLVTVSQADADANRTTTERLGKTWLSNIRKTVPLLSPRVNRGGA